MCAVILLWPRKMINSYSAQENRLLVTDTPNWHYVQDCIYILLGGVRLGILVY